MRIQLEYSQKNGCLNYGLPKSKPDEQKGFELVCSNVPIERANQFTELLLAKFPCVNSLNENFLYPELLTVRKEFYEYLKVDMDQLEIDMNERYRRRAGIFNNPQS